MLAGLGPARLLTSSAGRARGSAAYLERATGLTAQVEPGLQEIHLGEWQGLTAEEARRRFPDEFTAWISGVDARRGGGETYAEVGERAAAVLLAALAGLPAGASLVAVTHGGTARAVVGRLTELPPSTWWRLGPLGNARWSVVLETERGFRVSEYNAGVTEPPGPAHPGDEADAVDTAGAVGDDDAGVAGRARLADI